jgi:hypothetical protein
MMRHFLCAADAERALGTLLKLAGHNISGWALGGGLAVEVHCLRNGYPPWIRPLNDLDFVAEAFACVPHTLAHDFLFRHVHPLDPPGKTMVQFVDADTAVRIDLFRAYGAIMSRTLAAELPSVPIQLISQEDTVARAARLVLDLVEGLPVPSKHANDYLRLVQFVQPSDVEPAWQDHRRPTHPTTFRETKTVLNDLIPTHLDLLTTPEYSKNTAEVCARCVPNTPFPLADASLVLSLLGYC